MNYVRQILQTQTAPYPVVTLFILLGPFCLYYVFLLLGTEELLHQPRLSFAWQF